MAAEAPSSDNYKQKATSVYTPTSFDTNIVIITAALLFVLICALGMNAVIRWALNFARRLALQAPGAQVARSSSTDGHGINKQELIKKLPTTIFNRQKQKEYSMQQESQCAICLCDFQDGERIRVLPQCEHGFHVKCVDAWLCNHSSCPTCRGDLASLSLNPHLHDHDHDHDHAAHDGLLIPHYINNKIRAPQVQLQIVISPSGTLTPSLCRALPSQ